MNNSLLKGAAFAAAILATPLAIAQSAPAGYNVSLAENFNSFDYNFWSFEEGYVRNNEIQNYDRNRVWTDNGNLVINAIYFPDAYWMPRYDWGAGATQECHHASGSIWSSGNAYGYGIYEIRAKIPTGDGF